MSEDQHTDDGKAHDVLAAEAFAMPGADPRLHHGPLVLPEDPTGIEEPHDVLAAEEFPMPAVTPHSPPARSSMGGRNSRRAGLLAVFGLLGLVVIRRLRRKVTP